MKSYPALRRGLAVAVTLAVFAAVVAWSCSPAPNPAPKGPGGDDPKGPAKDNPAAAAGWPIYGGSISRNMVNTLDKGIPTDFAVGEEKKKIKWEADLGSKAYGGPIVSGGKIFIGTNNGNPRDKDITGDKGIVMCFNEADGKFLWQLVFDKLPAGLVWDWPEEGICSSPVVEGNKLWFVSNRCEVVCASTEGKDGKGEILWRYDMMKELGVFPHNLATCSPLLVGDTLFVVTSNGVDEGHLNIPAPKAPSFIALGKAKGDLKWQNNFPSVKLIDSKESFKELADKGEILMHGQWSNPTYAVVDGKPQVIFPGGNGWIYSFNPADGKLIWKFDCNPKSSTYELGGKGTRNDFIATPIVVDNKCYIGVGQDPEHKKSVGHLWCIDITKGKDGADVSPADDNFDPKAPANKNSALVWHFGGLGTNPKTPKNRNYVFGRSMSTCAVHDGLVYTADLDGVVYCLDAQTGELQWTHEMRSDCWCSPSWIDGKVFIGNDKGKLLIFQHGKEKKLLNTIDMEDRVRTASVATNGVLYIMTETKLYAIK